MNRSACRYLRFGFAVVVLSPFLFAPLAGCDRKETPGPATQPAAKGAPGAQQTPIDLPKVDVSKYPQGLRTRVAGIEEAIAKSGDAERPEKLGALGAIYFVYGSPGAAIDCFDQAIKLDPQAMRWRYYAGIAAEAADKPDRALQAYQATIERKGDYDPAYVRLGELLIAKDVERAAEAFRQALDLNPKNAGAVYGLGLVQEAGGKTEAALTSFEDALKIVPEYGKALSAKARVLKALGREDEAAVIEQRALDASNMLPNDEAAHYLLRSGLALSVLLGDAINFAREGKFDGAAKALELAREVGPDDPRTHQTAGMIAGQQGKFAEAENAFRAALAASPESASVRVHLADTLMAQNKTDEAEQEYQNAVTQRPGEPAVLDRYVRALVALQKSDQAVELLDNTAAAHPNLPTIHLMHGKLLLDLQRPEEAIAPLQAGLKLAPGDVGGEMLLAQAYDQSGDGDAARKAWETLIERSPKNLMARNALILLLIRQHEFLAAEKHLRAILEQVPDNSEFNNALAWILATSPNDEQRNGAEAVALAERANEQTKRSRHPFLDTLAAAYAEVGRFDDAIKTIEEAIGQADKLQAIEEAATYRERAALYRSQQPYRE